MVGADAPSNAGVDAVDCVVVWYSLFGSTRAGASGRAGVSGPGPRATIGPDSASCLVEPDTGGAARPAPAVVPDALGVGEIFVRVLSSRKKYMIKHQATGDSPQTRANRVSMLMSGPAVPRSWPRGRCAWVLRDAHCDRAAIPIDDHLCGRNGDFMGAHDGSELVSAVEVLEGLCD